MAEMDNIVEQVEALKTTGTAQLLAQYKQFFGDKAAPGNRVFLIRQLAYKIQEAAFGGISPKVQAETQRLSTAYDPINKTTIRN